MSRSQIAELKPFLSVVIVVFTLFTLVFLKVEVRRMGYSVWKLAREERRMRDIGREHKVLLAKATRPERLQNVAQNRLTLKRAVQGQIIQMTSQGIALKQ